MRIRQKNQQLNASGVLIYLMRKEIADKQTIPLLVWGLPILNQPYYN